ncbi:MAG: hypothetical protein ACAH80_15285 [Alphaproteobacteria bacterium]
MADDGKQSRFVTAQPVDPEQAKLREDAVREAFLDAGRLDFQRLAALSRNKYSEQLEQTGAQVTRYMRRAQGDTASASFIDPNQFTVGVALGMSDTDIARQLMLQQGVSPSNKAVDEVAESMRASYRFPYSAGQTTETHAPRVSNVDYYSGGPQVCVIVPPSPYYPAVLQVPGMTREQNIEFINLHESYHCRDTKFNFAGLDKTQIDSFNENKPETAIGNATLLQAISISNKQEALADVGALTEMIRKGADPKIIDGLIEWRKNTDDVTHMSSAALQDLKRTIEQMGVRDFRRMSETASQELSAQIADRNAPSPAVTEKMIQYSTGTAQERRDMLILQRDNPDMQKAMNYLKDYNVPPAKDDPAATAAAAAAIAGTTPLTPQEQAVFEQVRLYDATQVLQDRAFKDDKKITPETLVRAYRNEQNDLMRQLERHPGDPAIQARLEKLDESFVTTVQSLDYIAVNAARGVDITKDKALQGVELPPTVAPAAAEPAEPARPEVAEGGSNFVRTRPIMGM